MAFSCTHSDVYVSTYLTGASAAAQVCNLSWSKNVNEMVSTHGYSQNQIIVWKQPSMTKLATLTGHTMRVLYLAVSPDGQTIVTGAGALMPRPPPPPCAALISHSVKSPWQGG